MTAISNVNAFTASAPQAVARHDLAAAQEGPLPFEMLLRSGDRIGRRDVPCPACGPFRSSEAAAMRRVLRIWQHADWATYCCARCGAKGWARRAGASQPDPMHLERFRKSADKTELAHRAKRKEAARFLWGQRRSVTGSPVESYLRRVRVYGGPIPATIGFIPASMKYPHPKMIAAFGRVSEPEPGVIAIAPEHVGGVHLTMLREDGHKAGTERDKLMIGGELGDPIIIAPPNDLLGLIVTEGIEDGLSLHECTGLGVWVAGAAGRMPALAHTIPSYIDTVSIAAHDDAAGMKGAHALADGLRQRGIETKILSLNFARKAAA